MLHLPERNLKLPPMPHQTGCRRQGSLSLAHCVCLPGLVPELALLLLCALMGCCWLADLGEAMLVVIELGCLLAEDLALVVKPLVLQAAQVLQGSSMLGQRASAQTWDWEAEVDWGVAR